MLNNQQVPKQKRSGLLEMDNVHVQQSSFSVLYYIYSTLHRTNWLVMALTITIPSLRSIPKRGQLLCFLLKWISFKFTSIISLQNMNRHKYVKHDNFGCHW